MLRLENITKTYRTKDGPVKALDAINLQIKQGEFVALRGPSGCGKTTLLMTLAGMLRPTTGSVIFDEKNIYEMSIRQRVNYRAHNVGFVFQMFHLVPYLNIIDNIMLPKAVIGGDNSTQRATELIEQFGLTGRNNHTPEQLSAGEKQRVAIARAMLNNPKMILADEPTGNLDPDNAETVLGYLSQYRKDGGTVVIVTHGNTAQKYADRTINLLAGKTEN